jgi:UDP-2,3-diacylglucosamine hydrolase
LPESASVVPAAQLQLPAGLRCVDLASDLHLCPALPRTTDAFLAYLASTRADALFLLGDLFEAWVGDDALNQPFEGRCVEALRATAARMPVWVMHGNRDFLLGPAFFEATGVRPLADPTLVQAFGARCLLTHGDALCIADHEYQNFRQMVRQAEWQVAFLARPFSQRQALARQMRDASQAHQQATGPAQWADIDPELASRWLAAAGAHTLVHGHTHRPGSEPLAQGMRHVLSDWDLDHAHRAEFMRWSAQGWQRLAPDLA